MATVNITFFRLEVPSAVVRPGRVNSTLKPQMWNSGPSFGPPQLSVSLATRLRALPGGHLDLLNYMHMYLTRAYKMST